MEGTEHFHSIVSLAGFFCQSRFCHSCLKPYEKPYGHKCKDHCNVCFSDHCPVQQKRICPDCHQTCRSGSCFVRHKTPSKGLTVPCELRFKCPACQKTMSRCDIKPEDHRCGHYTCKACRRYVDPEHLCYARRHNPESRKSGRRFIFADIEASQKVKIVQCEWEYAPQRQGQGDCLQCRAESDPCASCRLCQHCRKSHCGKMKHVVVLAVC
jgi:hypothetical protein